MADAHECPSCFKMVADGNHVCYQASPDRRDALRAERERDALARRVAELEAALKEERGKAMSLWSRLGAVSGDLLAHADRLNDALASSGGTGEAREGGDAHASRRELHGSSNHGAQAGTGAAHPNNAGLREIAERAREAIGEMYCKCPVSPLICKHAQVLKDMDRVLSGERATRDEGAAGEGEQTPSRSRASGGDAVRLGVSPVSASPVALPSRDVTSTNEGKASLKSDVDHLYEWANLRSDELGVMRPEREARDA